MFYFYTFAFQTPLENESFRVQKAKQSKAASALFHA
jgi:hypothetical protein